MSVEEIHVEPQTKPQPIRNVLYAIGGITTAIGVLGFLSEVLDSIGQYYQAGFPYLAFSVPLTFAWRGLILIAAGKIIALLDQ